MSGLWADAFARVPSLLAAHVELCLAALVLAMLISLPLSVWAARSRRASGVVLTVASIIQTIPALALLALFYPLLLALRSLVGDWLTPLGFLPALMALTLYALLPIIRNAVTGLTGVDPAMVEAADGVGMTARQKLLWVEAPLAAPTIMAGIRTAAVWTIGIGTLATTIGQSSLGDLIFAGLQTQNWALVLAGCIASAGLALIVDQLLGLIQRGLAERKKWKLWTALVLLAAGLLLALGPRLVASAGGGSDREVVTVGAKGFSEQYILARMIGTQLERAGYAVRYREGLGSAVVFQALSNGDIDVYVDYAGTIWTNEMNRAKPIPRDAMRRAIGDWAMKQHGVRLVGALGFENAYAFAVRRMDARARGLKTLDDLARLSPQLSLGADLEFLDRPEWAQVKAAYPMRFASERAYDPTFMYRALQSGQVDAISAFSSDGRIAAFDFVTLSDPEGAIPNYDAIMMVSPKHAKDQRFLDAVQPLVGAIPVDAMRAANYMVDREEDKSSPATAAAWLLRKTGIEE
ncbi:ABC transporter permease/substrate-binding protein [Novosphingopyxis sp.]|uniref:ABC transporter permease/substrate-binding protein n=1 Tax=Novosphingopyxis sp. TaxID=2709690 RepID=UPI003B5A2390